MVQDLATAARSAHGYQPGCVLQILGGAVSWHGLPADVSDFAVAGVAVERLVQLLGGRAARFAQRRARRADVSMQLLRLRAAA